MLGYQCLHVTDLWHFLVLSCSRRTGHVLSLTQSYHKSQAYQRFLDCDWTCSRAGVRTLLIDRELMSEKTTVRFLGLAWEISVFSGAAGSSVKLSIREPNMSTLCCDTTGAATYCSSLSRLLNWKTRFCLKFAFVANSP